MCNHPARRPRGGGGELTGREGGEGRSPGVSLFPPLTDRAAAHDLDPSLGVGHIARSPLKGRFFGGRKLGDRFWDCSCHVDQINLCGARLPAPEWRTPVPLQRLLRRNDTVPGDRQLGRAVIPDGALGMAPTNRQSEPISASRCCI